MRPRCTVMHSAAGALFTLYASTQTRVFSISPKMYCIQSCTQKQAKNRIAKDRKPQQYDLTRDLGKEPARSIQGHDIKHQPCSIFQPMLSWRKSYLFHHPAEQCAKRPSLQQQAASGSLQKVQKPNRQLPGKAAALPRPTQRRNTAVQQTRSNPQLSVFSNLA